METQSATDDPQAGAAPSGQEPPPAAGEAATPQAGEGVEAPAKTTDPEAMRRELDEARREAGKLRKEKQLREREEAAKAAEALTDAERITKERDDLKNEVQKLKDELRKERIAGEARDIGTTLGLHDYRDALALIPVDQIEFDEDDGKPKNLEQLLRNLVKEKAYLAGDKSKPAPPSTGAAAGTSGGPTPRLTADQLAAAKMAGISPERYAASVNVNTLPGYLAANPPKT